MEKEKKKKLKRNTGSRDITHYYIKYHYQGYNYWWTVGNREAQINETFKVLTNKTDPEKVACTVATFFNRESSGSLLIERLAILTSR